MTPAASPQQTTTRPAGTPWLGRVFLTNLVLEALIIVTGGIVRLTGSGLGCPTWPECTDGSLVPVAGQAEGFHKFIEFGNRTLTGAVGFAALACILGIWRWAPHRKRQLLPWAFGVLAGVLAQAILGGITVRTGLHPGTVAAHFLLSGVLVAVSTILWWRGREGDGAARHLVPRMVRNLAWSTVGVFCVVMVLGTIVTGSGPHSGDAHTPARFDLSPRAMSWLHADSVTLFVGLVVAMVVAVHLVTQDRRARDAWRLVLVVAVGQGLIGYVQYLTRLPWLLVLTHMAGATVMAVVVTRAALALRTRD